MTKLTNKRGGETKAAIIHIFPMPAPRDPSILKVQPGKYPSEDRNMIAACKAKLVDGARIPPQPSKATSWRYTSPSAQRMYRLRSRR